jgi:hypothetical protein
MARNQTEQVLLRLTPEELEGIDRVRGESKRSTWIRELCMAGVRARDAFGGACGLRVKAEPPDRPVVAASVHALRVPGESRTLGHRAGCRCLNCERAKGSMT